MLAEDTVTLLNCSARDVNAGFIAAEADQQRLSWGQSVERQTSADKGHGADLAGDIEMLICCFHRQHFI